MSAARPSRSALRICSEPCSRLAPCSVRLRLRSRISHSWSAGVAVLLDDLFAGNRVNRAAHLVLGDRLVEPDHDDRAAGEVDAERQATARTITATPATMTSERQRRWRASASG